MKESFKTSANDSQMNFLFFLCFSLSLSLSASFLFLSLPSFLPSLFSFLCLPLSLSSFLYLCSVILCPPQTERADLSSGQVLEEFCDFAPEGE